VLSWLPPNRREANLHTAITRPSSTAVPVATTSTELSNAVHAGPADAIWLPTGTQRRRRLIDLGVDRSTRPT
jgi:hypothetical protein